VNGEQKTDFVPVCLWGKWAEQAAANLDKGDPVFIEGRIAVSSYEQDGKKRQRVEVSAYNVVYGKRYGDLTEGAGHDTGGGDAAPVGGPDGGEAESS
jgi:single-strand DNA-binding protein